MHQRALVAAPRCVCMCIHVYMWMLYCACVYVDVSTHVYTDAQYICCACACVSVCEHGVCVLHMLYVCVCTHTLGPRGVDGAMKRQEEKEEKVTEERNRGKTRG